MKRQPAVRCCGLSAFSEERIGGVQIDTFEVGLGFQEELGEVFGHLAADRVLEGSHVRLVQRLCVRCAVPLLGVTRARVHVRVNRVDHVQESVLRGAGAERLVHEGALDRSSFHRQSVSYAGLEFDAELAQHTAVDVLPSGDAETKQGCDGMRFGARRAPAPDPSPGECCKRVTCHGHALDRRGIPRTTASPRRVRACTLASWDLSSAHWTCRVCASAALAPRVLLGLAVLGEMGTAVFSRHDMVFVKGDVSWTNVSHDKRHTTTEPEPYPT